MWPLKHECGTNLLIIRDNERKISFYCPYCKAVTRNTTTKQLHRLKRKLKRDEERR